MIPSQHHCEPKAWQSYLVYFVTLSDSEGSRFFAEPVLSGTRFFATLRMTRSEGLRMTGEGC